MPGVTISLTGHNARFKVSKAAFARFHAQNGPLQVTVARFYSIQAKEMGQNLNEGTRIVNELPN
jgi:hypothetical protein